MEIVDGLKPKLIDRHGPAYSMADVLKLEIAELNLPTGTLLTRRAKAMTTDIARATEITNEALEVFSRANDALVNKSRAVQEDAKKASASVRQAAESLAQGMARVQKQADFNNLERYVNLLERAATAMTTLAELEKSGKLDKIAGALK